MHTYHFLRLFSKLYIYNNLIAYNLAVFTFIISVFENAGFRDSFILYPGYFFAGHAPFPPSPPSPCLGNFVQSDHIPQKGASKALDAPSIFMNPYPPHWQDGYGICLRAVLLCTIGSICPLPGHGQQKPHHSLIRILDKSPSTAPRITDSI